MGLTDRLRAAWGSLRSTYPALSLDEYLTYFTYLGNLYGVNLQQTLQTGPQEEPDGTFGSYAIQAYKSDGIVFACMNKRSSIFSEARFQFRRLVNGRPGDLYGTQALAILEHPWPNATTGDLLARAIQDVDLAGNFFAVRRLDRIKRLRPDWVSIIGGSMDRPALDWRDVDAEVIGYVYHPGGRHSGIPAEVFRPELVCHFAPIPDPLGWARGMSWLTPVVREIMGDKAATEHKLKFFENGATPNLVVTREDAPDPEKFKQWVAMIEAGHTGLANAYRTMYLTAGANAAVVGKDLQQLEFKATQGAGETRIAAASGIHPVLVGLSEGLQGSSLNTGNFGAARRLTADTTMRPLWRNFAGSMETIVPPPAGSQLWPDDRDIAFLREDRKDAAEIQQVKAQTIRQLVDAGYKADSVVQAVEAEDMGLLIHSGLFSVQLQPPASALVVAGSTNGSVVDAVVSQAG